MPRSPTGQGSGSRSIRPTDLGGAKGAVRGAGLGVIVGAIVLGPAGAVVGGAAGGVLNGLRNRLHDIGIDDKFMRAGHEGARQGQERPVHPVRGQLGRIDRDDRAGDHGRERPPDREHAAPRRPQPRSRHSSSRRSSSSAATRSSRTTRWRSPKRRRPRLPRRSRPQRRWPRLLHRPRPGRPDPAGRRRPEGQRRVGDRRDHDLRGPGRGQRAASPACAPRGGHGAARECRDVADAGQSTPRRATGRA